jgi:ubiquinone/menaquinone biosynthesis C-methylase UbiE
VTHYTRELRRDIIEWDVASWSRALELWDARLPTAKDLQALEVGARHGGLSLYLALHDFRVVCSDRGGPSDKAHQLHARHGVADRVTYADADATRLPFADDEFDIVAFKSVLGGIGGANGAAGQQQALDEMWRVLRPGGLLLFAENTSASALHRVLRRTLVPWGARWRYASGVELVNMLSQFVNVQTEYAGTLATFGRSERQREMLHRVDRVLDPLVPARWKYIVIGAATKPAV